MCCILFADRSTIGMHGFIGIILVFVYDYSDDDDDDNDGCYRRLLTVSVSYNHLHIMLLLSLRSLFSVLCVAVELVVLFHDCY